MAVLEQLVFGYGADNEQRRQILGHSPGLVGDCAQEVVRLCEGWGAVPQAGLRWPVLLSFPLVTRLKGLPGDLHTVIRIAPGVRPIYHAVVLNRADYQLFDLNPFALAQEDVFLSAWDERRELLRREFDPNSLAPLASPPPGEGDIGAVDEAVRQMLANQRLLLPLEQSSRDSDRFLALNIASLPRILRQDLRFASWAPSGTNRYSLAAVNRDSAHFSAWRPYLMTAVLGDLNSSCVEYLSGLQRCLRLGDLGGLERHSATSRVELGHAAAAGRRKPAVLTATINAENPRGAAGSTSAVGGRQTPGEQWKDRSHHRAAATAGESRRRPLRRYRGSEIGGVRRTLAILVALSILAVGSYFLWAPYIGPMLSANGGADEVLPIISEQGLVDVGMFYERLLFAHSVAGQSYAVTLDEGRRRRGLERLSQAGALLVSQSRDYVGEADRALMGGAAGELRKRAGAPTEVESESTSGASSTEASVDQLILDPAQVQQLLPQGPALARQLRLLALARISLRETIDWRDLARLDAQRIRARFDSLLVRRAAQGPLEPSLAEVQHLLQNLDRRTRQLEAVHEIERLLQQGRWDVSWDHRGEMAVEALFGLRHGPARQLRDDALLLMRFKRAEHATGIAAGAYSIDYGPWSIQTPAVVDIMAELLARVHAQHPGGEPPALLRATVDLYATMARAADPGVPVASLEEAIGELEHNRAVSFDPAVYGDHLARLRFRWMAGLAAEGVPAASMPQACFGDGPVREHIAFLDSLVTVTDVAGWRTQIESLTDPFLIRWARHLADDLL